MFQSDNCQRLAIPAIEECKYCKTGHCCAQNISQLRSLKSSKMPALRVPQQLHDQFLGRPDKFDRHLGAPILNANAVTVMAEAPVKRRMNPKFISAHWRWRPWFC